MNILQIVATILQAVAVVVTAFFASRGLHVWRGQLLGKRRFEIAEEIMVATYRVHGRLEHVRNPIAFSGEGKARPRPIGPEVAAARKDMYFVSLTRLQEINDDFAQMSKARLLARVHFGLAAAVPFDEILSVFREIAVAARMLVDTAGENRQNLDPKLVQKWEATIWDTSDGTDALGLRMQAAVSEIESLCRPALMFNDAHPLGWWRFVRREVMRKLRAD